MKYQRLELLCPKCGDVLKIRETSDKTILYCKGCNTEFIFNKEEGNKHE